MSKTIQHYLQDPHNLLNGWRAFHRGLIPTEQIRPAILHSWQRSQDASVSPTLTGAGQVCTPTELIDLRLLHAELVAAAAPQLEHLSVALRDTGQVITLCDPTAHPLVVEGDVAARDAAERINLVPGSDWREEVSGTNAMGLAATLGQLVAVFAAEHYVEGLHEWACVASPIHHPVTRQVVGILDITGRHMLVNRHTEMAVLGAVQSIEARLGLLEFSYRHALADAFAHVVTSNRYASAGVVDRHGSLLRHTGHSFPQEAPPTLWLRGMRHLLSGLPEYTEELDLPGRPVRLTFRPVQQGRDIVGALVEASRFGRSSAAHGAPATPGMVGQNPAWLRAVERAGRAARTDSAVLVTGETGTGKEVLARSIHQASRRSHGPFLAINCGALPPSLATSELFGYAGGAFTGANPKGSPGKLEAASGGTLFLDEVAELSPEAQVLLLRVLEERAVVRIGSHHSIPVDVRMIAATHRDLEQMVAAGTFRQDLFFRLNVVRIHIPPLRERREDILPLVEHGYRRLGVEPPELGLHTCERLTAHHWPGNVRELLNLVEQAVALDEDPAELLPLPPLAPIVLPIVPPAGEEEQIRHALAAAGGNAAAAARRLGIGRSTLYRKLEQYGIRLSRNVQ